MSHPWSVSVVIPAAGIGSRMGATVPKQYLEVDGMSILRRTVMVFASIPYVEQVIIACAPQYAATIREQVGDLFDENTLFLTVDGGAQRQDSVRNALHHPKLSGSLVAIHDAVRPNVSRGLIDRVCEVAAKTGAAIPALSAKDTVKRSTDNLRITETLPRQQIWLAQTPQVFETALIVHAHENAFADGYYGTDDASLIEYMGRGVDIVEGEPSNVKITTPEDLAYISAMKGTSIYPDVRVGHGYDVHQLESGRKLVLGGVEIPHEKGLLGHSDADALLHSITDAIIGALALGDIGSHFPDTDPDNKNLDSRIFLRKANELATKRGYRVGNIDSVVVAEKPKLRTYIDAMRDAIAKEVGIDVDRVSVKATTSEKMGFVGRGEGMAAMATVLLVREG
jgi:2-C-methyl-D-erythritol 4-phosphate cytidylyltransferase / 2-C-methyl-D-erythritol 2,4-cyclodiphosphate synthase